MPVPMYLCAQWSQFDGFGSTLAVSTMNAGEVRKLLRFLWAPFASVLVGHVQYRKRHFSSRPATGGRPSGPIFGHVCSHRGASAPFPSTPQVSLTHFSLVLRSKVSVTVLFFSCYRCIPLTSVGMPRVQSFQQPPPSALSFIPSIDQNMSPWSGTTGLSARYITDLEAYSYLWGYPGPTDAVPTSQRDQLTPRL